MLQMKRRDWIQASLWARSRWAPRAARAWRPAMSLPWRTGKVDRRWDMAMSSWPFIAGAALGCALMYMFDPHMGRRRRKMAIQRATGMTRHAVRGMGHGMRRMTADVSGKRQALLYSRDGREPLDDATLAHKVESVLFRDPHVPKGRININAEHGTVVLRGDVDAPDDIRDIERTVRRIDGVQEVRSLLHLVNTSAR